MDSLPSFPRTILAVTLIAGCIPRACSGDTHASPRDARGRDARVATDERCREEIAHATVATVPGLGAIDALIPTCDPDSRTLVVWAMRGHTLSRIERPLVPGATFRPGEIVSTGADRLGPIATTAVSGPIAWRSPTLALDDVESDEIWTAVIEPPSDGSALRVLRGSASMPGGTVGLGIVAPIERTPAGVHLLATVAREGENPRMIRLVVPAPQDEAVTLAALPPALADGELKAYEPTHRVALAYAVTGTQATVLQAFRVDGDRLRLIGSSPVTRRHVLVIARGVDAGRGRSAFVWTTFDVARGADAGACMALDETLCVNPGPLMLGLADDHGLQTFELGARGLPDTIALDASGRLIVMMLTADRKRRGQQAVRVDLETQESTDVTLVPGDALPPMDHPALVRCGNEPWIVAEVLVDDGAGDAAARRTRESAVIALPFECLAR